MANANRGLGKGLGALLGDAALRTDTSDNPYYTRRIQHTNETERFTKNW